MKRILFIANGPLEKPIKGTPIRIKEFFQQIKKEHQLVVVAENMDPDPDIRFIKYPRLSKVATILYFKKLIREQNIDIVFITSELLIPLPIILKFLTRVKIVIDLHGLYFDEWYYQKRISLPKKLALEWIGRLQLMFFDLIFTVSGTLKDFYRWNNSNIQTIYGGVKLADFQPLLPQESPKVFTIGYAGNYQSYQGFGYLLEAASRLHQAGNLKFRLRLVLSGDQKKAEAMIDQAGLLSIADMYYNVPHTEVNAILAHSDVLVIARPRVKMTQYAYPSKLPEYLATGIPTILTAVGPVSELFTASDTFVKIIPAESIGQNLYQALCDIADLSSGERYEMGQRAREFVSQNLTWEHQGVLINNYLTKL
jgi:glycosyltransferase involved in cell wall biosynthesis